jgi:hypothetical protein
MQKRPAQTSRQKDQHSLALPCFLAFRHRLQAPRRAAVSGAKSGTPLLAYTYASIKVAINGQRGGV